MEKESKSAEAAEEVRSIRTSSGEGDKKIEKTISVEEIENGFIISESKEWRDKKEYKYETKKYYSKINPIGSDTVNKLKNAMIKNMPGS